MEKVSSIIDENNCCTWKMNNFYIDVIIIGMKYSTALHIRFISSF